MIPLHAGLYKIFEKAGRKGWEALVPFYNYWVWLKLVDRPWYWIFTLIFPGVNLIVGYAMMVALYRAIGKDRWKDVTLGVFLFFYFVPKWAFSKDLKWLPKEQRFKPKKSKGREWLEAAVFAVVVTTIFKGYFVEFYQIPTPSMEEELLVGDFLAVSKLNYGVRVPNTPLSFPFVHNSLPGMPTTKSYLEIWKIPYFRLPAIQKVHRNDVMVFNFPVNDTTINDAFLKAHDYYGITIQQAYGYQYEDRSRNVPLKSWNTYLNMARQSIAKKYPLINRPLDKKENFIKRCVAIPGDKLQFIDGVLYINDAPAERPRNMAMEYQVKYKSGFGINPKTLKDLGLTKDDFQCEYQPDSGYSVCYNLTDAQVEKIRGFDGVLDIKPAVFKEYDRYMVLYPHDTSYRWTRDNYGPVIMPAKGSTVELNMQNISIYARVIEVYEHNQFEIKDGKIYINGAEATSYTFKQDYYYLVGDNRHRSQDSRFWGFVPHDHVLGKALFIWMSMGEEGVRWKRIFRGVH